MNGTVAPPSSSPTAAVTWCSPTPSSSAMRRWIEVVTTSIVPGRKRPPAPARSGTVSRVFQRGNRIVAPAVLLALALPACTSTSSDVLAPDHVAVADTTADPDPETPPGTRVPWPAPAPAGPAPADGAAT